jgi:hypothetical protein
VCPRSVADLELFCRTVFGVQGLTHDIAPLPYRDVQLPSKLRFGYYTSGEHPACHLPDILAHCNTFRVDCYVKASPANKRAVLETVEALRKAGHECVEFGIQGCEFKIHSTLLASALGDSRGSSARAIDLFVALTSADGYKSIL